MANHDSNPARDFAAVTPSDTVAVVGGPFDALYVGVAGDVVIVNQAGTAVTFKAAPIGFLPVSGKRVKATGTTATNIVALWQ